MNAPRLTRNVVDSLESARRQLPFAFQALQKFLPRAHAHYGCSYSSLTLRALMILRRRFLVDEAFWLGLFDPSLTSADLSSYLSKSSLKRLQRQLNPRPADRIVEDKGVFYRRCRAVGLPTPELYAVVYRGRPGWTAGAAMPVSDGEWESYLESALPSEFVVKPACGVYGKGFTAYARYDGGFRRSTGEVLDAAGLLRSLRADPRDRGSIIQERLRSHPEIACLSGSNALQTLRVDVVMTTEGPQIIGVGLKIIRGANLTDNLDHGITGNFIMRVSPTEGMVLDGRIQRRDQPGFVRVSRHPDTGKLLTGFRVPLWQDVRSVALRAMNLFKPLKAIGWDIAVTPTGVRVIEGNAWFDPAVMMQGRIASEPPMEDPADTLRHLYSGDDNWQYRSAETAAAA